MTKPLRRRDVEARPTRQGPPRLTAAENRALGSVEDESLLRTLGELLRASRASQENFQEIERWFPLQPADLANLMDDAAFYVTLREGYLEAFDEVQGVIEFLDTGGVPSPDMNQIEKVRFSLLDLRERNFGLVFQYIAELGSEEHRGLVLMVGQQSGAFCAFELTEEVTGGFGAVYREGSVIPVVAGSPSPDFTYGETVALLPLGGSAKGPKGDKGEKGEEGEKGEKGDTGDEGPEGKAGAGGIGEDSFVQSAAGTGELKWEHAFSEPERVRGLLVLIVANDSSPSDEVSGVTFEKVAMEEIEGSPFLHAEGTEDGVIYGYFLPGPQLPAPGGGEIAVTVSGASVKRAVSVALAADVDLRVESIDTEDTASHSGAGLSLPLGRGECVGYMAVHSALNSPAEIFEGEGKFAEHDFGSQSAAWFREPATLGPTKMSLNFLPIGSAAGMLGVAIGPVRDHGLVTTLPSPAGRGDVCRYYADANNGVIWDLIYDGKGNYPWKKVGGPPLTTFASPSRELTNKTAYQSLAIDPLKVTLPLKGDYDITIASRVIGSVGAASCHHSYAVGATAASDTWAGFFTAAGASNGNDAIRTHRHIDAVAAAVVEEKARTAGNWTNAWALRRLTVDPVRVG